MDLAFASGKVYVDVSGVTDTSLERVSLDVTLPRSTVAIAQFAMAVMRGRACVSATAFLLLYFVSCHHRLCVKEWTESKKSIP